jgi:hypothetical protein
MVVRKILVGGGAAALLSLGTLIGGISTGLVGAHSLRQQAHQSQAAPSQTPSQAPEATGTDGADAPVTLPAGSVSQDAAKQAAVAYVQSTAPYSSQGLSATQVSLDDENGAAVFKVEFSASNGQSAEVTVSAQGTVLKAESGNDTEQGAQSAADSDGPGGNEDSGSSGTQISGQTNGGTTSGQGG